MNSLERQFPMKVEELFRYSGMVHVFAFNYDIGPKRLTFQLQLLDYRKKQNASFHDRPTIYSGAKFRRNVKKKELLNAIKQKT